MRHRTSPASSVRHVLLAVTVLVAALAAVVAEAPPVAAAPTTVERQVATMVNNHRIAHGRPPLPIDAGMSDDARVWAGHMAATGLAHARDYGRSCDRFVGRSDCRENVGFGTSAGHVQAMFERSPGHDANLLCDCTHIGVGVVTAGGRTYVVQRFVHDGHSTEPPMRASMSSTEVTAAQAYVRHAYRDLVGRDPQPSEVDHWTTRVLSKVQRTILARALGYSDEWIGALVDSYYQVALGRPADAAGRRHWIDRIRRREVAPADVAALFYASDEYFARRGGDVRAWVDDLYQELLARRPDGAGRDHWARVAQVYGRPVVSDNVYSSTESLQRRVDRLYTDLLGRRADPAGLAHWAGVLQATRNDVELAVTLVSSTEYHRRAQQ